MFTCSCALIIYPFNAGHIESTCTMSYTTEYIRVLDLFSDSIHFKFVHAYDSQVIVPNIKFT